MKAFSQVRNQVWSQVSDQVPNQIWNQTRFRAASLMSDQMTGNVFDQIWGYILREYVKK